MRKKFGMGFPTQKGLRYTDVLKFHVRCFIDTIVQVFDFFGLFPAHRPAFLFAPTFLTTGNAAIGIDPFLPIHFTKLILLYTC